MNSTDAVLQYRPMMLALAHEMLGNMKDAEDAVQDTFLKWFKVDNSKVENAKSYLLRAVKNNCINKVQKASHKQEVKTECSFLPKMPELHLDLELPKIDFEKELPEAFNVLMKKLNASERGVYLLREIFNFDYQDISEIMEKKAENCRKILDRAKKRLVEKQERFQVDHAQSMQGYKNFIKACKSGQMSDLISYLQKDLDINS
ncbi:sigma-70 family RNA polymerase sigma factor [Aureibacter tunicatorum]|uniref:RNA polymerase sigma-70 factor (ECF subfamily) n=1 Tax=Aureibacter tunicatorum TaxID=866807 RepID=A0AAE3XIX7_9BACT|nr:sigma-70 family RNA polymerase sigma factor [Aureibacter tunicatorum]MDR6237692.1 RNA polymerase sigma-70 factor (ECF subfamily) [Aureibacter tunicatorum]BDD02727.1 hypothetical protein AUTU_02100 [Aureibacter tunicatorum]